MLSSSPKRVLLFIVNGKSLEQGPGFIPKIMQAGTESDLSQMNVTEVNRPAT